MSPHDFSRLILIPLFVVNMGAMVVTLRLKKNIKPQFAKNINRLYIFENIIGLICCIGLAIIAFFL